MNNSLFLLWIIGCQAADNFIIVIELSCPQVCRKGLCVLPTGYPSANTTLPQSVHRLGTLQSPACKLKLHCLFCWQTQVASVASKGYTSRLSLQKKLITDKLRMRTRKLTAFSFFSYLQCSWIYILQLSHHCIFILWINEIKRTVHVQV